MAKKKCFVGELAIQLAKDTSPTLGGNLAGGDKDITALGSLAFTLGTTVDEFSIDGALAGDSDSAVPTEKSVKEYVDAQNMIGEANADWVTMTPWAFEGDTNLWRAGGYVTNISGVSDGTISFYLPIPFTKNGRSLTITKWRFSLFDADANNEVNRVRVIAGDNAGNNVTIYDDNSDAEAAGDYEDGVGNYDALDDTDVSGQKHVKIAFGCGVNAAYALDIAIVEMKCYYS